MAQSSSKPALTNLPPEIRNMIYRLILVRDQPISIFSSPSNFTDVSTRRENIRPRYITLRRDWEARPRPASRLRKYTPSTDSRTFFCVNKEIYAEAGLIFYSCNTFAVGNGCSGSTGEETLTYDALKTFISRVPKRFLERITKINMIMHLKPPTVLGSDDEAKSLHAISRALVKHLKGLEIISLSATPEGNHGAREFLRWMDELPRLQNSLTMEKTLRILVKHPHAREIIVWSDPWHDTQGAVERIYRDGLDTRKLFSIA